MPQSIGEKATFRQVARRVWTLPGRRWLRLEGRPFRHIRPWGLWLVILPAIVFGMPTVQPNAALTLTQLFQNANTRAILQAMQSADLPLARGVVSFLLAFARAHGGSGDALMHWDTPGGGVYNDGAQMYLNGTAFDSNDPYALASFAGQITHEALEIYFRQADGVPGDTLPMDYLAEYEGGLVMQAVGEALSTPLPDPGTGSGQISTLGRSYADWLAKGNGSAYQESGDSGTYWHFFWWSGPLEDQALFGNPMGLSLAMLRWETACGQKTLPDWQTRGCAEASA